jgi:hypothetical protein
MDSFLLLFSLANKNRGTTLFFWPTALLTISDWSIVRPTSCSDIASNFNVQLPLRHKNLAQQLCIGHGSIHDHSYHSAFGSQRTSTYASTHILGPKEHAAPHAALSPDQKAEEKFWQSTAMLLSVTRQITTLCNIHTYHLL